jgi:hypothetical protein
MSEASSGTGGHYVPSKAVVEWRAKAGPWYRRRWRAQACDGAGAGRRRVADSIPRSALRLPPRNNGGTDALTRSWPVPGGIASRLGEIASHRHPKPPLRSWALFYMYPFLPCATCRRTSRLSRRFLFDPFHAYL